MKLVFNKYKDEYNLTFENLIKKSEEDISLRVITPIGVILERVFRFNGELMCKVVYHRSSEDNLYHTKTKLFIFKEDGKIYPNPVSIYHKQPRDSGEYLLFKAKVTDAVFKNFQRKVDEVGSPEASAVFDAILNDLEKGRNIAKDFGRIDVLIEEIKNSTLPYMDMDVFDWSQKDKDKWGIDYTPKIREWLLLYFNEDNYKIYPEHTTNEST